jgi:hypothetical protein
MVGRRRRSLGTPRSGAEVRGETGLEQAAVVMRCGRAVRSGGEGTDRSLRRLGAVRLATVTPAPNRRRLGPAVAWSRRLPYLNFFMRIGRSCCGASTGTHGEVE